MQIEKFNKNTPKIDSRFFWDVNFNDLNWDQSYVPIIARIIERGGQEEINEIVLYYGVEKVKDAITRQIKFLPNYAIERVLFFFPEIKKEEIHCYLIRKEKSYQWV